MREASLSRSPGYLSSGNNEVGKDLRRKLAFGAVFCYSFGAEQAGMPMTADGNGLAGQPASLSRLKGGDSARKAWGTAQG